MSFNYTKLVHGCSDCPFAEFEEHKWVCGMSPDPIEAIQLVKQNYFEVTPTCPEYD